jgi:DNA-directed RNA polymerase subunit omega
MARVTVEDCLNIVSNRFALAMLAAYRAKDISKGVPIMLDRDNDKDIIVALREIAEHKVDTDTLEESYIKNLQKTIHPDTIEPETLNSTHGSVVHMPDRKAAKVEDDKEEESEASSEFLSIEDDYGLDEIDPGKE